MIDGALTGEADLAAYGYDGSLERSRPDGVLLVRSAEQARRAVAWCVERGVPFLARGAGTNLSGGCVPLKGGLVLAMAGMDRVLAVDAERRLALAEPGVVNLRLQQELARAGLFFAPDPASYKVCTLGGNIGENAGGPRCLKYGTTTNHVRAVEAVMPDGSLERFSVDDPGPEVLSLLIGAEGTLGTVVKAWVDVLPLPPAIATLLAAFPTLEEATACVSDIVAAGVAPRVLEAMDRLTVESIEAYVPAGYPKAEAVLLIELEGPTGAVAHQAGRVRDLLGRRGCLELRQAASEAERDRLWEGRRSAYAALARLAPNVLVEDGVVPRSRLAEAARKLREICLRSRVTGGLLFHAGDGNLHPNLIFDERDREATERVKRAGFEMLATCVEMGGSISGEHGIGTDKRAAMAWLFSEEALALQRRIKAAFDPGGLSNPDKVLPLPGERPPGSAARPEAPALSGPAQELVREFRARAARGEPVDLVGTGSRAPRASPAALSTRRLCRLEVDRGNLVATAEAGIGLEALRAGLAREGVFAAFPGGAGTLGGLLAAKPWAGLRQDILAMRLLLSDGTVLEAGSKVVKSVAGYDVPRLLLGSWGTLAVILEATFKVHPVPVSVPAFPPAPPIPEAGKWWRALKGAFDPEGRLNAWVLEGRGG